MNWLEEKVLISSIQFLAFPFPTLITTHENYKCVQAVHYSDMNPAS